MTLAQESKELTLSNSERLSPSSWNDASRIVRGFTTEPAFIEALASEGVSPTDPTTVEYANALSDYSESYCNVYGQDESIEPNRSTQIRLLAGAPRLLHSLEEINFYRSEAKKRALTTEEKAYSNSFKPYLVWYNQLLSDYNLANPTGKMSTMTKALTEQSLVSFPHDSTLVESALRMTVRGARTEAASQQLLNRTSLDYSPGTIDDDLQGGDVIVMHKGLRIKVDLKSSLDQIATIRGGYDKIFEDQICYAISKKSSSHRDKDKHVIVLFPGFTDSDLGDSLGLHLPEKDMQNRANNIERQIRLAFRELRL